MCDERERLIGYVYDECDPVERQVIETHLASCHICRHEIRGLRNVRQDLLAWDVPAHEPVWRPMAPPRAESPWRSVPAWAMAAAAGVILVAGAAGGAVTHALLPGAGPAVAQSSAPVDQTVAGVTAVELSALETRVVARLRAEMDERVQTVSAGQASQPPSAQGDALTRDLARRVNVLTSRQDEVQQFLLDVATQSDGIRRNQSGLEQSNRMLVSLMQGPGGTGVFSGDR